MRRAFSMVELIVAMVVMAIIMYAAIAIFITSGTKGVNVEVFSVAQMLAEGKLEQVMSKDFGWVSSEAQTPFSGNLSNFSYRVVVNYVSREALDTTIGGTSDYKKIIVQVGHPQLSRPTTLESLKTNY